MKELYDLAFVVRSKKVDRPYLRTGRYCHLIDALIAPVTTNVESDDVVVVVVASSTNNGETSELTSSFENLSSPSRDIRYSQADSLICNSTSHSNLLSSSNLIFDDSESMDIGIEFNEDNFKIAINLVQQELDFELRVDQVDVMRIITLKQQSLLLGAPTNFGKSLCVLVPAFCVSNHLLGWARRYILCIVPNVIVLSSIADMLRGVKTITYCTPGHLLDIHMTSDQAIQSFRIVNIWTLHRLSCYFQGQLHKSQLSDTIVRERILNFQKRFSTGLIIFDECHSVMTSKFKESGAGPRLIKDVRS